MKIFYFLMLAIFYSCLASAGHYETAQEHRKNNRIVEAALAASNGCMEPNGVNSCAFLCALGLERSNDSWFEAGCSLACSKGSASSCSTLGSRKISRGQTTQGLQLLRTGCSLGDNLACETLKILKK